MKFPSKALLALLTLAAVCSVASCGDAAVSQTGEKITTAQIDAGTTAETEEAPYLDNLPEDLDFNGYTIRCITSDDVSFDLGEDSVDIVDVAVYKRNTLVSERLNVNFSFDVQFEDSSIVTKFKNSVTSGSDDYDMFAGYCYWSIIMATQGYLLNMTEQPYIDLSREYWGSKFIDAMAYKDYKYWLTGDIVLSYTSGMYATYVNLNQWNSYFDESVYDIVREGTWTMDKITAYSKEVYRDLNGNSKVDADDFLGYVYTQEDSIDGLSISCGVKYTEFNEDGVPELYITKDPSTAIAFADKLYALCQGSGSLMLAGDGGYAPFIQFANGNVMFIMGRLKLSTLYLREMEDDFAIVPMPKLDEAQENYLTTLHDGTTIIGLPKTMSDEGHDATLAALEALSSESYKSLTPVYLDDALKYKYSRDADSAEMIDLIRSNIVSDFGYQFTSTGFNNLFRNLTNKDGATMNTQIAKRASKWEKSMNTIISKLEDSAD